VVQIMLMRVEAGNVAARAIQQGAAPLRMALGGGRRIDEAEGESSAAPGSGSEADAVRRRLQRFVRLGCSIGRRRRLSVPCPVPLVGPFRIFLYPISLPAST